MLSLVHAVKPLIAYASPSVETLQGRDVTLMCVVLLGNPPPTITWYKMGERLTNHDDVANGNGQLALRDVGVADEGEYTCVASNAGGNATQTTHVDVHGTRKPVYVSYSRKGLDRVSSVPNVTVQSVNRRQCIVIAVC